MVVLSACTHATDDSGPLSALHLTTIFPCPPVLCPVEAERSRAAQQLQQATAQLQQAKQAQQAGEATSRQQVAEAAR